jgi:Ca2+-binding EF-hand superfamily protein
VWPDTAALGVCMTRICVSVRDGRMRNLFALFDMDSDGSVDFKEVRGTAAMAQRQGSRHSSLPAITGMRILFMAAK